MHLHKTLLHCHSNVDPCDTFISYSTTELIDEAAQRGVSIISLTSHKTVVFNEELRKYAAQRNILLIPGVECQVKGRDVIILNAHTDANTIKNIDHLREYRSKHPESFIFAPHPFFPGPSLKDQLEPNIDLFDGVELSHFFHKYRNYNKPAEAMAKKYNLPYFATPDCHFLNNVDIAYCTVELEESIQDLLDHPNPSAPIFSALRERRFSNHANPLSLLKISKTLVCHILWGNIKNYIKGK